MFFEHLENFKAKYLNNSYYIFFKLSITQQFKGMQYLYFSALDFFMLSKVEHEKSFITSRLGVQSE